MQNSIINNELNWNAIAKSFDKTRQKPWSLCIDFIENLSKNDIVLDLGCGNGRHSLPCTKIVKHVISLDISIEFLNIVLKKKLDNNSLILSNFQFLPLKNNSIDAALFIASLHNIKKRKNRIDSLIELNRILKKNGKALISVWSKWQDKYRKFFIKKFFHLKNFEEHGDIIIYWKRDNLKIPRFYHLYSRNEFISDIKSSGLNIIKIYDIKLSSKKYVDNYFALVRK
jgi:ubiquinone/menaquinone biosynthesis C-methylase UbiE